MSVNKTRGPTTEQTQRRRATTLGVDGVDGRAPARPAPPPPPPPPLLLLLLLLRW